MSWDKVVPEVLDAAPKDLFEIRYPTFDVKLGQEVKPGDLLAPPSFVNWPNIDPNAMYAMTLVDCDHGTPGLYNLGTAVNMPSGYITKGFVTAGYDSPKPKEGTGLHRYVVAVYKQAGIVQGVPIAITPDARENFNLREFAKKYQLELVAGTYFLAQADDYTKNYYATTYSGSVQYSFKKSGKVECVIS